MAINPLSPLQASQVSAASEPTKKSELTTSAPKTDAAIFSAAATSFSSKTGNISNPEKIAELKAKIAAGTYRPNPAAIADKLLQEAWALSTQGK